MYGGRFREFLTYFQEISQLFLTSWLFSHLFLKYFPFLTYFPDYFSLLSCFPSYFSVTFPISQLPSQLFLSYLLNRSRGFGAYWREKLNPRVTMDEIKFLYECVKAGKLSNAEAKEFLSSGGSSESRERGQQLKVATGAATVPAVRNEADSYRYVYNYSEDNW